MGTLLDPLPSPPMNLSATPSDGKVVLAWAQPVDGSAPIDYYIVYQNGIDIAHPTGNTTTVTGLQNGNTYNFAVAAHNAAGIGAQSASVVAVPQATTSQDNTMVYAGIAIVIIAAIVIAFVVMRRKK
jgi:hypothetical protein